MSALPDDDPRVRIVAAANARRDLPADPAFKAELAASVPATRVTGWRDGNGESQQ